MSEFNWPHEQQVWAEADAYVGRLATADVRIGETFSYEDWSDVYTGKVVYPEQILHLELGAIRVSTGSALLDLDTNGKVTSVHQ